jgi:hypothetical protein
MSDADIAVLGASKVGTTGCPVWQPVVPLTDDESDIEGFGEAQVFQSLGVSSLPYQKDDSGFAECLMLRNVGGRDAVCIGARDTRTAKIAGNMKPGDTVVHSTGPSQAAQLQLKEEKQQAVLVTKNANGETMAFVLDGKNSKCQLAVNGAMFEIDPDGNWTITDASGKAGIRCANGQINIFGKVVLGGGLANPAMCIMLGPVTGSPGSVASVPLVAAQNVSIGM